MKFEDLTGKTFDQLTVLNRDKTDNNGHIFWLCRCVCGKEVIKSRFYFSGKKVNLIYSCGCKDRIRTNGNLVGKKYGKWLVIKFIKKVKSNYFWLCRCECGNERIISEYQFRYGKSKSCGCTREQVNGLLPGEAGFNQLLLSYKKSARKRNLEFNLSSEEFKDLVSKNCYYCNSEPSNKIKNQSKYSTFTFNGIDRVDNLKGYFKGNCVPCCKMCNQMKHSYEGAEFIEHCILIDDFQNKKK
jgi:hypothetical protein